MISSDNTNKNHFILKETLPAVHLSEIDYLKHKFNIRKEITGEEDRCSPWILPNSFSEKCLFWIFGVLMVLMLLLTVGSCLLVILSQIFWD